MSADELLRAWLRQQRELGEESIVLENPGAASALGRPSGSRRTAPASDDWREALRASGGGPPATRATKAAESPPATKLERIPAPDVPPPVEMPAAKSSGAGIPRGAFPTPAGASVVSPSAAPPGLIVGGTERELFGGPNAGMATLEEIAATIASCTRCPLHRTAKNPVPGQGNPRAELVCVGEAPGATEDEQGLAFVGQAGQLLTSILKAIQLTRDDVFIVNVLKHRPPGNRNPMPDEVTACKPYLIRQLDLIQPKVIVALGTFAAQTLLDTKLSIGKLRGQVHRYYGVPLVVTYHPAALLRNPGWKRPTWEDVQLARRILDHARASA